MSQYWWAQVEVKKWEIGRGNDAIAWTKSKTIAKVIVDALNAFPEDEQPCLNSPSEQQPAK